MNLTKMPQESVVPFKTLCLPFAAIERAEGFITHIVLRCLMPTKILWIHKCFDTTVNGAFMPSIMELGMAPEVVY
jgi:hypothetical protein